MIYFTGDTHGGLPETEYRLKHSKIGPDDTLIICGDFGFDWNADSIKLWNLFDHKYTILFCDGNHENYDVLNNLPTTEMYGDTVGVFGNNTFRLLTGHMYNIEGKKCLVFGGAASIDKDWRVEPNYVELYGKLWWEEEVPDPECYNMAVNALEKVDYKFDYLITHTCAPELKATTLESYKVGFFDPTEVMIRDLQLLIKEKNGDYRKHYFGHFHVDRESGCEHCLYEDVVLSF